MAPCKYADTTAYKPMLFHCIARNAWVTLAPQLQYLSPHWDVKTKRPSAVVFPQRAASALGVNAKQVVQVVRFSSFNKQQSGSPSKLCTS